MEKTKACHCECHMSSGHSFGQKRLIPLGVSKSVVIASDRTGLSICRARIEPRWLLTYGAISCVYARDCQTRTVRFLRAEEMSQVLSNLPRWSAAIPTLLEFSFKH